MFLALLKNPLTKMVFNKATEHFKHKAEKVKTIREAEILACKEVDVARIKSQDKSWKDEILLIWLISNFSSLSKLFLLGVIPNHVSPLLFE